MPSSHKLNPDEMTHCFRELVSADDAIQVQDNGIHCLDYDVNRIAKHCIHL